MKFKTSHGTFCTAARTPSGASLVTTAHDSTIGIVAAGRFFILYDAVHGQEFQLYQHGRYAYGHLVELKRLSDTTCAILCVCERKFLSAVPSDATQELGYFGIRDQINAWEMFEISPSDLRHVPTAGIDIDAPDLKALYHLLYSPGDATVKRAVISAVLADCPHAVFTDVSQALVEDRFFRNLLCQVFTDPRIAELGALVHWLEEGRKEVSYHDLRTVPQAIARTSMAGYRLDTVETLLSMARRQIRPLHTCCVVTTIKNEGIYILDWVAHYRALGVDRIFIYSNDNTDGSDALLRELSEQGIIIWLDGRVEAQADAQSKSYAHALMLNKEILNYTWAIFVDMDEFVCVDRALFSGIADFLNWHAISRNDAIALNWSFVTPFGQKAWHDAPIYARFEHFEAPDHHVKTISRPGHFHGSRPHEPLTEPRHNPIFVKADKSFFAPQPPFGGRSTTETPVATHALVYHYFCKSAEEFLWKFSRNRGDFPVVHDDIFLNMDGIDSFIGAFVTTFEDTTHTDAGRMMRQQKSLNMTAYEALLKTGTLRQTLSQVQNAYAVRMGRLLVLFKEQAPQSGYYRIFRRLLGVA